MSNRETYTSMLIGVAFFVGGMIATLLIVRYLNKEQPISTYEYIEENKDVELTTPEMMLKEFFTRSYNITDNILMLDENSQENLPWTSIDLTNNGPNPIYFSINNYDNMESPLPAMQSINIDLTQPQSIKKLFFRCDKGQNANIRLYIVK